MRNVCVKYINTLACLALVVVAQTGFAHQPSCALPGPQFTTDPNQVLAELFSPAPDETTAYLSNEHVAIENDLKKQNINYIIVKDLEYDRIHYVIDVNGASNINRLACQVYLDWRTVLTMAPDLPSYAAGAFEGLNKKNVEGRLYMRDLHGDIDTLYHELLHAYLTHQNYQGLATPLSFYYFRDPLLERADFLYGNYFSGQEIATYTFQGLLYPERTEDAIEKLLNLLRIAKEFTLSKNDAKILLTKKHNGMEMVGLRLMNGDFFVPTEELVKQNISKNLYRSYITNKLSELNRLSNKTFQALAQYTNKTEFDYLEITIKPRLTAAQKTAAVAKARDILFSNALKPKGYLIDFKTWTETIWSQLGS